MKLNQLLLAILIDAIGGPAICCGAIMSFAGLPTGDAPGAKLSTYHENGISLFAANGPPTHFHSQTFRLTNGPSAFIYANDGFPQRIAFNDGEMFSLFSVEVLEVRGESLSTSARFRFTSSSESMHDVTTSGTVAFGAGFQNIAYVQIDSIHPQNNRLIIDNIHVVPEPSATVITVLAVAGMNWRPRRLSGQTNHA